MSNILVTVVMGVYNQHNREELEEAVRSILAQTLQSWELIICDDGSDGEAARNLKNYENRDKRIRVIRHSENRGLAATLNTCIAQAKGKYIARMDADDKMHPDRLRIQKTILDEEPSIDVCATWAMPFGEHVKKGNWHMPHAGWIENPLKEFIRCNFVCHPTVMVRRSTLEKHQLAYSPGYPYAEDYKLWVDMAKRGAQFYVEDQPLMYYRCTEGQASSSHRKEQIASGHRVQLEVINHLITQSPDAEILQHIYTQMLKLEETRGMMPELFSNYFYAVL